MTVLSLDTLRQLKYLDASEDASMTVEFDDYGGIQHRVFAMLAPAEWDRTQIAKTVEQRFPAQHCQHSHDCCGRFYPGRAELLGTASYANNKQIVFILITYTQNV